MKAVVKFRSVRPFERNPRALFVGGYSVRLGESEVPFDFYDGETVVSHVDGHMMLASHLSNFDPLTYRFAWDKIGLTLADLTAERLGGTGELIEVTYECYAKANEEEPIDLEVVSFTFIEGEKEYAIAPEVIAAYNQKVLEEQA